MKFKNPLNLSLAITTCMLAVIFACSEKAQEKPNIILIIADDMAWDDSGAYGNTKIKTPNIDRLAREGMKFNHAFLTISSCSPSRSSIITGLYPHNTDAEQLHWPLPAAQTTFVELLKEAGYYTVAVGKWHLGEAIKNRFDKVVGTDVSGFQLPDGAAGAKQAMVGKQKSGCENWVPVLRQRPKDRPFFLWLAALDPHRDYEENSIEHPHSPQQVRIPPYLPDVPEVRKDLALYYDEISRLDGYVGKVISELERQGVRENTMILFISDNGRPFPRDKTTLFDGGIRTPFIVSWPAQVGLDTQCDQLVSSIDIAPTVLSMAEVDIPEKMQGKSFIPLLFNDEKPIHEFIFAEDHWHDYEDLTLAARSLQYKYIKNIYNDLPSTPPADAGRSITFRAMDQLKKQGKLNEAQQYCYRAPRDREEFYDLIADPFELNNLAADPAYSQVLKEHREALEKWEQETDFEIPEKRTPDEFDRRNGTPLPARKRPRPDKKWFIENYGIE